MTLMVSFRAGTESRTPKINEPAGGAGLQARFGTLNTLSVRLKI
jgi:hypothetical protein